MMGGAGARRCCSRCLIGQDAVTAADQGILGLADTRRCLLQGCQGCDTSCTACRGRAHSQRILCIAMATASVPETCSMNEDGHTRLSVGFEMAQLKHGIMKQTNLGPLHMLNVL